MARGSQPSFPPQPSEPNLQRLRQGRTSQERPLRPQVVVFSMAALIAVAVPLYIMRRPSGDTSPSHAVGPDAGAPRARIVRPNKAEEVGASIELGDVQRVKCSAASSKRGNEGALCDPLPFFESALRKAIRSSESCAPKTGKEGTINYVLEVDFNKNRINVFPGRSGKWRGPQAKAAAKCVLRSFPSPPWDRITHRYRYYMVATLAKYPAPDPLEVLPRFE